MCRLGKKGGKAVSYYFLVVALVKSSDEDFLSDLLPKVCLEVASLATDIYVVMLMALQGSRFFLLKLRDPFKQTTQKQHLFILLSHNENSQ